ncbi:hypothetical protein [Kribbella sandramycini]|uniref:Protein RecA n=1 Tax=Kribbella sandramycini TaxID=60450 RepID=A0A841SLA9_9ACTN|nr:hypothetical protein [Kribbella sandramycini]MBB6568846.1 hypothetical protein [Kribbella sandramycini]
MTGITALDEARAFLARAKSQGAAGEAPAQPGSREPEGRAEGSRTLLGVRELSAGWAGGSAARWASPRATEARLQQALDTAAVERDLPTSPLVTGLLGGAALRAGAVYSVRGSTALVMALMAGPSAEGAWCGVVGVPTFGAEAARGLGVDLDRLVLVPDPGPEWLSVVAALVDALTVVVVRPPGEVTPGEAARLAARLRTRGAVLISTTPWPGSEARLELESSAWTGLGTGEGLLTTRQATIRVTTRRTTTPQHHQIPLTPHHNPAPHPPTPTWQTKAVS